MAGSLDKRIKNLEATYNKAPCEECGWAGDHSKMKHVVEWVDPDESTGPEWCETCGHQTAYVITWGDDILTDPRGRREAILVPHKGPEAPAHPTPPRLGRPGGAVARAFAAPLPHGAGRDEPGRHADYRGAAEAVVHQVSAVAGAGRGALLCHGALLPRPVAGEVVR